MVAAIFDRDVIRVTGAEAAGYLQGQLSQDIDAMSVGGAAWSLVLDPTGKLVGFFRLHRVAEQEFLIDTESGTGEAVVARLERFKLRTDVTFTAEDGWRMVSVRGEEVTAFDATDATDATDAIAVMVEWPEFDGVDLLGPGLEAPESLALDGEAFESARIAAGIPRMGADMDAATIPAEGGAALVEAAVSFTKGCYTGQELVARIDSRGGNVPRPLRRLRANAPIEVGTPVTFDGQEVGVVTSAAGSHGLARVLRKVEPGAAVTIGTARGTIEPLQG